MPKPEPPPSPGEAVHFVAGFATALSLMALANALFEPEQVSALTIVLVLLLAIGTTVIGVRAYRFGRTQAIKIGKAAGRPSDESNSR